MQIRRATVEDLPRCIEMGREFHREAMLAEIAFDESSALATLTHLIGEDGALFVAQHENGALVGMAAALKFPHYINLSANVAQELFWWVDPAARGGSAGMRLLAAIENWARDAGCVMLTMICLPIDSPAQKIYERVGYRPLERSFAKGLH